MPSNKIDWNSVSVGDVDPNVDYYAVPSGAVTLNDLVEHKDMNFAIGNIFKACYRLGDKDGVSKEYDLNKIIYYANRELNNLAE